MLNISFQLPIRFHRGVTILAYLDQIDGRLDIIYEEFLKQNARIATLESAESLKQASQPIDFLSASPTTCEQCKLPLGTEPTMPDTQGLIYHRECAEKLIQMHGGTTS